MKPELQWEIESGLNSTAMEVAVASRVRTAWYHSVSRFFEKYDFMIAPASQVFPFEATTHWPKEVGGVSMDTYHRWMQVMIPISMSGCPALSVPAGFNDRGLPMGIQIVGPNHAEMVCMQLAHAYDQATNWVRERPPALLNR
jgi:amidase